MIHDLAQEFLEAAGAEPILAVVYDQRHEDDAIDPVGVVTWTEAEPRLRRYGSGKGDEACRTYAWTATRILFVHEYDSMFGIHSLPRNPIACVPCWQGQPEWKDR